MKKWLIALLSSVILVLPVTSVPSFAAEVPASSTINNGLIINGRVLVPLRAVTENLGASLEWFQADKVVKIKNDKSTIWLAANFNRVIIESAPSPDTPDTKTREYIDLDMATQVIKGTAYVPLHFVGQSLGASVAWDQLSKQATVTLGVKELVVKMENSSIQIPESNKITNSRLEILSEKLNQASNVLLIKNVNTLFQPYFTDRLIKSIVQNKGLDTAGTYETPVTSPVYSSITSATFSQSVVLANGLTGEDQYAEDRTITLKFTDGVWKVDSISKGFRVLIAGFSDWRPL